MAQLISLSLTVSCSSKIQIGFTFLVPAHLGSPDLRAVKRVYVWVDEVASSVSESCVYVCRSGISRQLHTCQSYVTSLICSSTSINRSCLHSERYVHCSISLTDLYGVSAGWTGSSSDNLRNSFTSQMWMQAPSGHWVDLDVLMPVWKKNFYCISAFLVHELTRKRRDSMYIPPFTRTLWITVSVE